jgi:hypothetical protein
VLLKIPRILAEYPEIKASNMNIGQHMKFNIKMKRVDLLRQIKENKARHLKTLKKVLKAWRKRVMDAAENLELTYTAKGSTESDICAELDKLSRLRSGVPTDMSDTYDSAIAMVESHSGTTLELAEEDFKHLVEDEWMWKHNWEITTSAYLNA